MSTVLLFQTLLSLDHLAKNKSKRQVVVKRRRQRDGSLALELKNKKILVAKSATNANTPDPFEYFRKDISKGCKVLCYIKKSLWGKDYLAITADKV